MGLSFGLEDNFVHCKKALFCWINDSAGPNYCDTFLLVCKFSVLGFLVLKKRDPLVWGSTIFAINIDNYSDPLR